MYRQRNLTLESVTTSTTSASTTRTNQRGGYKGKLKSEAEFESESREIVNRIERSFMIPKNKYYGSGDEYQKLQAIDTFLYNYCNGNGNIIHEMKDGYPQPKINNNRKILGFGVAPQQLGIGASFRYKDFNAGFLLEGKSGGSIYSGTNLEMLGRGLHKMTVPSGGREAGFVPQGVMENVSELSP